MAQRLDPDKQTEEKLSRHIDDLQKQFTEESLRGLSEHQLREARNDVRSQNRLIRSEFPPEEGITGHARAWVKRDDSEAINPLSVEQKLSLEIAVEECERRIQKELTRRRDAVRERRYQRLTELLDRLGRIILGAILWLRSLIR